MDIITLALAKKYTNEKILEASLGGEVDLSKYAKKTDLPSKNSQLENDTGFITKETSDLENYLTREQIQNLLEEYMSSKLQNLLFSNLLFLDQTTGQRQSLYLSEGKLILESQEGK